MENIEEVLLPPPPKKEKSGLPLPPLQKNVILLGSEYTNLTPRKPTKKQKSKIDHTIDRLKDISDDEIKAVYEGMGASVYLPTFREYVQTFWNILKDETKVKADFRAFKSTQVYEKFMLNAVQFSSAKSVAVNGMLKTALFNEDGVRKGYSEFKRDATEITDIVNSTWMRTEYDCAVSGAVNGEKFRAYREDADLYSWWIYLETTSAHPREEHLDLVGNIYKIGDPDGDACHPQNGFNCACGSEQVDGQYLDENGKTPRTNDEAKEDLENYVSPQFRFNSADQGILPKEGHSYFQALPNANDADGSTFGITDKTSHPTKLKAIGLHQFVNVVHEWKIKYHTDNLHEIIFQNEDLLSNVLFNNKSFTNIAKHAQGTDNLPETIISPSEVWSRWNDAHTQQNVIRCYIRGNYVVETLNSVITDAHLVDNVNRFRKGVIIF